MYAFVHVSPPCSIRRGDGLLDARVDHEPSLAGAMSLLVWFFDTILLGGKLQALRQRAAGLAQLQPGEVVPYVGCGTGAPAREAYKRLAQQA